MSNQLKCVDKVKDAFDSRIQHIKTLFYATDNETEELGSLFDYGLCIDFVKAGTYPKQREDYWIYQISWGGPSEEFRIYKNGEVEFWYLNWFDGASTEVEGEDKAIIIEIVSWKYPEVMENKSDD